jgi:lipid II:glycine glycyltransferase (peptidoglycan interpeptide bridge formation enzyme)
MRVGEIPTTVHEAYIQEINSVSPLQTPDWAGVKPEWGHERLGWFNDEDVLSGVALVLSHPQKERDPFAYIPEGPVLDWNPETVDAQIRPMLMHLGDAGMRSVKMDPRLPIRRWNSDTIKQAIADPDTTSLRQVAPDETHANAVEVEKYLETTGWQPEAVAPGTYGNSQPKFVYQLPLEGDPEATFAGFSKQWRRNIRKAEKAGVEVISGGNELLPEFCDLYAETALRDGFTGRPKDYFRTMHESMTRHDPSRMEVYVASHEGEPLASSLMMTIGDHAWYMYGASSSQRREVQASTALQWQMIQDACGRGVKTYDFRGITDAVDGSRHQGVLQFKLGANGRATEYTGAWTYRLAK